MITLNKLLTFILKPFNELHVIGAIGGGLMAAGAIGSAIIGSKAAKDAARASRFAPVGIETGQGTVSFEDGQFRTQLSPEQQQLRNQLWGLGQQGLQDFQTFDPAQAGGIFTQQLTDLAAPQEQQAMLNLENRNFAKGLTGATAGQMNTQALFNAQATAQQQRELTGLTMGQQQQERLFQNALGAFGGAQTIDQSLSNQLQQAISASGAQTSANTNAAQFNFQAGQNNADALAGFFGNLGQSYSQYSQPQQQNVGLFTNLPQNVDPRFLQEQQFNFQGNV
jgi:hypothetical protein